MPSAQRYVTAQEAASSLGISVATLYAYVSRGLLRSEPGDGSTRARRYLLEDVEALRTRKEYRREPAKAAESALVYGMPVLDSSITLIENGSLYYRGHDVLVLAREHSFEEVTNLLWTGELQGGAFHESVATAFQVLPLLDLPREEGANNPIEQFQAALATVSAADLAAHQHAPAAVARTGARILGVLKYVATGDAGDLPLAAALRNTWAPQDEKAADLLSAALILCADHELNVSAFTARCVASAGASPYAVVIAALSALQGYRHGGHTARTAALLKAAEGGVRPAIAFYLQAGDQLPGFGHPLYPEGDPRGRYLLERLNRLYPASPILAVTNELCGAAASILGQQPTIDLALAALAAVLGSPRSSPLALFALGRTAGWIGHAIEQYALDQLIRPRARYVGLPPR
jgi:citrate synthase